MSMRLFDVLIAFPFVVVRIILHLRWTGGDRETCRNKSWQIATSKVIAIEDATLICLRLLVPTTLSGTKLKLFMRLILFFKKKINLH